MQRNNNFFYSWWWKIDRIDISLFIVFLSLSSLMVATASPAIAERIGVAPFYFMKRQMIFIMLAIMIVFLFSLLSPKALRVVSFFGYIASIALLVGVLLAGIEIKGAKRWLNILGISVQPSEIIKPFFIILSSFVLSKRIDNTDSRGYYISTVLYGMIIVFLLLQPDFGMIITTTAIWVTQLFLAGLSVAWIIIAAILSILLIIICYITLPHVANRINRFLDPDNYENYQVKKSLEAYKNGGFFGKGPGEGQVKQNLPDSHTDFIFSVIGEELGIVTCIAIVLLFAFIIVRNFFKLFNEEDHFKIISVSAILVQLGLQSIINIGVTLHLLPTKGMTLPFISYGGSSMVTSSILMGMLLALTKKKFDRKKGSFVSNMRGFDE
jgi:cell division protein FtsW